MEYKSKLLNEAIADAKAVRETAVQTAIHRLKESFEPTVRKLITTKLAEEESYEEEDETMDDMASDTGELDMSEMEPAMEPSMESEPEMEMDDDSMEEGEMEMGMDDETDPELEEILRELDNEMESDEYEDDDLEESLDEFNRLYEEEDEDEMDSGIESLDEELDSIIQELVNESEDEEYVDDDATPAGEAAMKESRGGCGCKGRMRKMRRDLNEAYSVIKKQNSTIKEVALLNSKLLYLTKITSNNNISAKKQVKILEAFDRANTIREVKLVYSTIVESIRTENKSNKLREVASRPMRSDNRKLMTENSEMVSRWQKLAGIRP